MALHFQLLSKETGNPVPLSKVDEILCNEVLKVAVHPKMYGGGYGEGSLNWFDTIGFEIACGKELGSKELRDEFSNSDRWGESISLFLTVLDHMEANYTSTSF